MVLTSMTLNEIPKVRSFSVIFASKMNFDEMDGGKPSHFANKTAKVVARLMNFAHTTC